MAVDYNMDVVQPMDAALKGYQSGLAIRSAQQEMALQEEQLNQAQAMRNDLAELAANPKPTAEDYRKIITKNPSLAEHFKTPWEALNKEQQAVKLAQKSQIFAAASSGNYDIARNLLEKQREAAKNSGDQEGVDGAEALLQLPDNALSISLGLGLAALDPDKLGSTFKNLREGTGTKEITPYQREYLNLREKDYGLRKQDTESKIKSREATKTGTNRKIYYDKDLKKFIVADADTLDTSVIDPGIGQSPQEVQEQEQMDKLERDYIESTSPDQKSAIIDQLALLGKTGQDKAKILIQNENARTNKSYRGTLISQGEDRLENEQQRINLEKQRLDEQVKNNQLQFKQRDKQIAINQDQLDLNRLSQQKGYNARQLGTIEQWRQNLRENTEKDRELLFRTKNIGMLLDDLEQGKPISSINQQKLLIEFGKLAEPTNALMQGEANAYIGTDDLASRVLNFGYATGSVLTRGQVQDIKRLASRIQQKALEKIKSQKDETGQVVGKYGIDSQDVVGILDADLGNEVNEVGNKARSKLQSIFGVK